MLHWIHHSVLCSRGARVIKKASLCAAPMLGPFGRFDSGVSKSRFWGGLELAQFPTHLGDTCAKSRRICEQQKNMYVIHMYTYIYRERAICVMYI